MPKNRAKTMSRSLRDMCGGLRTPAYDKWVGEREKKDLEAKNVELKGLEVQHTPAEAKGKAKAKGSAKGGSSTDDAP